MALRPTAALHGRGRRGRRDRARLLLVGLPATTTGLGRVAGATRAGSEWRGAGDWRRVGMSYVAAYILVRNGEAAIVDLGTAGSESAIEEGLKAAAPGGDR